MKKYLAGFAVFFVLAVIPALAQYGQYDAPPPQQQAPPPPGYYPQGSQNPNQGPNQGSYQGSDQWPNQPSNQNPNQPYDPGAGPSNGQPNDSQPGVARISFMRGDVSSQRGDNGEWVAATLNTPVAVGDRVSTGQGGRAEIQLDATNVLRLADSSTAKVAALDRGNIQIQVGQGQVTFAVLRGAETGAEIDTPNASIHPLGPGDYRILVSSDSETAIIVRSGSVDVSEPQGTTRVNQGQMATIAGTDNPQYKIDAAIASDEWDSWNAGRDQRISSAQSWQKTDRYYTGTEDLDNNGTWSEVPDYGPVWTPSNVDPDWVPYRDGRWVYEPYYGWTWVSYEPWGWAPYHYGRWFVYGGRWGWWPGPVGVYPGYYPVWSPAYVSFFGFGGSGFGFGIGFGFGGGFGRVGWLPVGPGDWYHPWYGRFGGRYNAVGFDRVNNFHEGFGPLAGNRGRVSSNFDAAARNDRVRSGISSMDGNQFGRAAVPRNQERISEASFRQATLMTGRMPVSPSHESFSPSGRAANPSSFRNAPSNSQRFFSASHNGSGFNSSAGSRSFTNSNAGGFNRSVGSSFERPGGNASPSAQSESRGGWQHFSPPSQSSQSLSQSQQSSRSFTQQGESQRGFSQSPSESRGASSNSYYRSPLNMRQPIVTPRGGYNTYGNQSGRSYSPQPAYSQPRSTYSAPARTYSAPSQTYRAPAAQSYSAPRGNNSAPRGSGGGGGSRGGSHGGGNGAHSNNRR